MLEFVNFACEGLFYWLFAIEYLAASASIKQKLKHLDDVCVKQVVQLFWIVAIGYVILLAGTSFIDRGQQFNLNYFWHGGVTSYGMTTLMFTACTLTLLYSASVMKSFVQVTKSVKPNNTFKFHCLLFIPTNVAMIVGFILTCCDNVFWTELFIGVLGVLSTVSMTYIATRLVKLSKPPENSVCPVSGSNMNTLTKIYSDQQLMTFLKQNATSIEEKERLIAMKSYEEIALEYESYLGGNDDGEAYVKIDERILGDFLIEVSNQTLFEQLGEVRTTADSLYFQRTANSSHLTHNRISGYSVSVE